jgi:hypothetical protein
MALCRVLLIKNDSKSEGGLPVHRRMRQLVRAQRVHGLATTASRGPKPMTPEMDFTGFMIRLGSSSTPTLPASTSWKIVRCSESDIPQ